MGAELCRQLAEYIPAELISVKNSGFNAHSIDRELQTEYGLHLKSYLKDITNRKMLMKYCVKMPTGGL